MDRPNVGQLKQNQDIHSLIKALQYEEPEIRRDAAYALGNLYAREALSPLMEMLAKDGSDIARYGAAAALEKLLDSQKASVDLFLEFKCEDLFLASLRDSNDGVRVAAVKGLGRLARWVADTGDPKYTDGLIAALQDSDQEVRRHAAAALGGLGDLRAVEPLMRLLKDEYMNARIAAANALGNLKDGRALPALMAALEDREAFVREAAASAISDLPPAPTGASSDEQVEKLISLLKSDDPDKRENAAQSLGNLGGPLAIQPLMAVLEDPYKIWAGDSLFSPVARRASVALKNIALNHPESFISLLSHPLPNTRRLAAAFLRGINDARVKEALQGALNDGDESVRRAAKTSLEDPQD